MAGTKEPTFGGKTMARGGQEKEQFKGTLLKMKNFKKIWENPYRLSLHPQTCPDGKHLKIYGILCNILGNDDMFNFI